MGFAVDRVVQGQVLHRDLLLYRVSVMSQLVRIHVSCGTASGPVETVLRLHNNSLLRECRTTRFGSGSPEVMYLKWCFLTLSMLVLL